MERRDEPLAKVFRDERFLKAWGYAGRDEVKKLIGCLDDMGQPDLAARKFYRPLRQWALHGKIDKAQFCEIRESACFEQYLRLFALKELTADELLNVAKLYCENGGREDLANIFQLTGVFVAYGRGSMSLEQVSQLIQCITADGKCAAIVPELLESGVLSEGWQPYAAHLEKSLVLLDMAIGGFIDSELYGVCYAGNTWDAQAARRYFGVENLSKLRVTTQDVRRANHSRHIPDLAINLGRSVTNLLEYPDNEGLLLCAEIRRRLERARAAAVARASGARSLCTLS